MLRVTERQSRKARKAIHRAVLAGSELSAAIRMKNRAVLRAIEPSMLRVAVAPMNTPSHVKAMNDISGIVTAQGR